MHSSFCIIEDVTVVRALPFVAKTNTSIYVQVTHFYLCLLTFLKNNFEKFKIMSPLGGPQEGPDINLVPKHLGPHVFII